MNAKNSLLYPALLAANDFQRAMEAVCNSRSKSWYPHQFCDVFIQQVEDSGNPSPCSTAVIEYRGSKITRIPTCWRPPGTYTRKISRAGAVREIQNTYKRGPMEHILLVLSVKEELDHERNSGGVQHKRLMETGRAKKMKIETDHIQSDPGLEDYLAAANNLAGTAAATGGGGGAS